MKFNSRLLTEGLVAQNLVRDPVPEGLDAGFDMRELRKKPTLEFCWPIAGQRTVNGGNPAQLRACNSNKTCEQQRARTGLVKLANRRPGSCAFKVATRQSFAIQAVTVTLKRYSGDEPFVELRCEQPLSFREHSQRG